MGVRAIGAGGLQHPHPHAQFGAAREIWGNQTFTKFPCFISSFFFLWKSYFLFRALVGVVKTIKLISGLCVESNSEQHP